MKKFFFYIPLLFLTAILFQCQANKEDYQYASDESQIPSNEIPDGPSSNENVLLAGQSLSVTPQKIIKTANIRFQVEDFEKSSRKIAELIKKNNAYESSNNRSNSGYAIEGRITIRVPAANFDPLLQELSGESIYLDNRTISAEDVTEQYVDAEARLKTKREVEKRFLEILKQAKTIEDILKVESQLGQIRTEIEAHEGKLKYLNDRVGLSTINLEYYKRLSYQSAPEESYLSKSLDAFSIGWGNLTDFTIWMIYIWPFWLLLILSIYIFRKIRNRKKQKVNAL